MLGQIRFHSIFQAGNNGKEEWNASSGLRKNITHQFYTAGNQSWEYQQARKGNFSPRNGKAGKRNDLFMNAPGR